MNVERVEREIAGRKLIIEAGRMAKQANGAVTVQYGDTMVLTAVVTGKARPGIDFFPLMVEYREKGYAAGKIPGGRFLKRETRPSVKEVLTCRMIDRPIRPLFPEGMRDEVQVSNIVLSADNENDPDLLAMIGASAALTISDIPFDGPTGSARVGRVDDEFIINPTLSQVDDGSLDLVVSCVEDAVCMVEAGADELPEDVMLDGVMLAFDEAQAVIEMIKELGERCGKPKMTPDIPDVPDLESSVASIVGDRLEAAITKEEKGARAAAVGELLEEVKEKLCSEDDDNAAESRDVKEAYEDLCKKATRKTIAGGGRIDGRAHDEIRPITCDVGNLPRTHGSSLFTRGETQALVVATLGTKMDEEHIDGLLDMYTRKFMMQYNFPSFCVGETGPDRGPRRRDHGHGALSERAVKPVLPGADVFPYTIRVVSDIMESNGSSSMASVCGGSLSMMDAGIPISRPVAGIAMGLVQEGDDIFVLSDILGDEDHYGDMDFKVAGTKDGITALQMDCKIAGLSKEVLSRGLEQARNGRLHILGKMLEAIAEPREDISQYAPRLMTLSISTEKIGSVIGPGGKTIREIEAQTGAKVEIDDDGTITIASPDVVAAEAAKKWVEELTAEAELNKVYTGRVVSLKDFGAFVEILPGQDGLVHISELDEGYVEQPEDVVTVGDELKVKVIQVEDNGKIRLSRKEVLRDERRARGEEVEDEPRGGGGRGRDRKKGGGRGRDKRRSGGKRGGRGGRGGGGRRR